MCIEDGGYYHSLHHQDIKGFNMPFAIFFLLLGLAFLPQKWTKVLCGICLAICAFLVKTGIDNVPQAAQSRIATSELNSIFVAVLIFAVIYAIFITIKKKINANKLIIINEESGQVLLDVTQQDKIYFDKKSKYGSFVGLILLLHLLLFGLIGTAGFFLAISNTLGHDDFFLGLLSFAICAIFCYISYGFIFKNKNYGMVLLMIFGIFTLITMYIAIAGNPIFIILAILYGFISWYLYDNLSK